MNANEPNQETGGILGQAYDRADDSRIDAANAKTFRLLGKLHLVRAFEMRRFGWRVTALILTCAIAWSAEASRTKEALEQFNLETLRLWHVDRDKCGVYAVILDANDYAYRVRRGNYVGRNFGLVAKISKNRSLLRELYKKPDGIWEEREAFLGRETPSQP